jgi:nucleotide-binding universal stress UspA family protein
MNRCIVVAIDAYISPQTLHVLGVASSLLELSSPQLGVVLLHVIPVPSMPPSKFGMSRVAPTVEQRERAEQALHRARIELQKQGIIPERIELLLRSGIPTDEIVKAAKELEADFIMIGSRGNSLKQKMRRLLTGSISHRVVKLGSCPVMIASLPQMTGPRNLVGWYKEAITHYMQEHPDKLVIFTSYEVAHLFVPPLRTAGSQEVNAASAALEQLASSGVLVCQKVNGELRCIND